MKFEKEYINYLIKNIDLMDHKVMESYLLGDIDLNSLVESIDVTKYNVMSYKNFVKSNKIDDILGI